MRVSLGMVGIRILRFEIFGLHEMYSALDQAAHDRFLGAQIMQPSQWIRAHNPYNDQI